MSSKRFPLGASASRLVATIALLVCASAAVSVTPAAAGVKQTTGSHRAFVHNLRPKLLEKMAELRVPGSIVLVDLPGHRRWLTALGTADLETGAPMRTADHMRIGSVTKTFTATVILQLVDQGRLGLDDPVSRHLHGVHGGKKITVRQLLNMTSGLVNFTEDVEFNAALDADLDRAWEPKDLLPFWSGKTPYFKPGEGSHYSNTNYLLLGEIAEAVTDKPLDRLMRRRIFKPLGMHHTLLPERASAAIPAPHPRGYNFGTNTDANNAYLAALAGLEQEAQVTAGPNEIPSDATFWSPSYTWADGGAISTAHDLAIWAKALAAGSLLTERTQAERLNFVSGYGLGVEHVPFGDLLGHNGAIPGFQTFVGRQRHRHVSIVVLANLLLAPNTYLPLGLPADELAKVVAAEVLPGSAPKK